MVFHALDRMRNMEIKKKSLDEWPVLLVTLKRFKKEDGVESKFKRMEREVNTQNA